MLTNCNLLLESLSEAVFLLDKDGFIKYSNNAASTITGYATDELLNAPLSILYFGDEDRMRTEYELGVTQKKGKFVSEGWKRKKDGSKLWAALSYSIAKGENGEIEGYSCLLQDLSARKKTELNLRESEERFRMLVEGIKDYSIFMLDPNGYVVTWNEGAKRMKGYYGSEIIGKHFSVFYAADDLKANKAEMELKTAIDNGKYEEEGWRVRKNGSMFWANIVLTALFNDQNKLIGFSKITRDLTDRRENEEVLRQSEERYRLLVEQVTDYGIFMLDEKGRIVSWNEGARRMKGYNANEIIGKYFSIFYPEEDIINGKPGYELQVAMAEGKYEEEGWRLRKDGSRFWANVVITAVYNAAGTLVGFSKVTRDLSERKASEKALRDSYDRYRNLADELKITNRELTLANEELEQFTSIVSHDLQEPVRTIKSFLQLIEMKWGERIPAEPKLYIEKATNAIDRMKELIRNLLHYSQLTKEEIIREDVNVSDIFNEALQNVRTSIEASNAEIIIENQVGTIRGDRVQLVQLMQNLVSNALKFTSTDTPRIKIRCTRENGEVKFSVSDNGIGIAEGDLNKVFEIFRRLHTKKEYPGTGIGLAICKKIVDRHGGRIWPESKPGRGTTFYFTLNEGISQRQPA
jgi:PAS domain S-box-containing protein